MRVLAICVIALGLVMVVDASDAEAACYLECCWGCYEQTQGCGAGCYTCNMDWPSGGGCSCDGQSFCSGCCCQCITFGMCFASDREIKPAIDAKKQLAMILREQRRGNDHGRRASRIPLRG